MTEVPVDEECRAGGAGTLPFPAFLHPGCSLLHPGAPCSTWVLPAPFRVLPAPPGCSPLNPGCSPLHLRCSLLCPGSLPLNPRCSLLHPGAPCSASVSLLLSRCYPLCPGCSPLHPACSPPPSSALGLSLRVHGVGWPPQGGMGPVLMPSLGAGQRHRPELPHVSEEGQHRLRPEAALHWVGGHPGGHHGCVHLVSTQAQRCERGLPG